MTDHGWDTIAFIASMVCEKPEIGKMAWLLGMQTETAYKYSKKIEKRG